jgi:hypothetical protein
MDLRIPKTIVAGDTPVWTDTPSDFPATDGWSMRYVLAGPTTLALPGTAEGGGYRFAPSAEVTAAWPAGLYSFQAKVQRSIAGSIEQRTIGEGQLEIRPSLEEATAGTEVRTRIQQEIALLDEAIRKRLAGETVEELRIGSRTYRLPALELLYDLRNRLSARADAQARKPRKVLVRFGSGRVMPPRVGN